MDEQSRREVAIDGSSCGNQMVACAFRIWWRPPCSVETVTFSPDGSKLLYGYGGSQVQPLAGGLVRLADNAVVASYAGHLDTVLCSAFSPDGKYALLGDCDDHICVWEAETGRLAVRLRSEGWPIYGTGFSPDGRTIGFGYSHLPGSSVAATNPITRAFTLDRLSFCARSRITRTSRAQAQWGNLIIHRESHDLVTVSQFGRQIARYGGPNLSIHSRTLLPGNRAAIGLEQSVVVFDALTGRPIYRLPGHLDAVWAVTPSPDQKHLLTGSDDETLQIWNLERYEHTLSLFFAGDDWVAWTPQGYYAASPGGENLMGWHVQRGFNQLATFYPASRFRKRFYRPELIRRVLSAGGSMQALKQLEGMDGGEAKIVDIKQNLPPQVTVTVTPPEDASAPDAKCQIQVAATPQAGDSIRSLKLLVDGRPGPETRDDDVLTPAPTPDTVATEQQSRITWELALSPGPHRFVAKADSERSIGLSDPVDATIGAAAANRPRLLVLAVGVSGNQRPDLRRTFASVDAQAIGNALNNQPMRQFSDIQVRIVIDPLVTRFNLEEGFRWLQQTMTADDVGIVYFAGYVLRDQQDTLYFQHQESRIGDPAAGMPDRTLLDYLRRTAGNLLLVLDVVERDEDAQNNPLAPTPGPTPGSYERLSTSDLVRSLASEDYGVAVLAMTSRSETAGDAVVPSHSPFAQSILDGISGKAEANSDSVIDFKELINFVRTDIKARSTNSSGLATAVPALVKAFPIVRRR